MGTNHGGVNFGRRLPPIGGQYSTPINTLSYRTAMDTPARFAKSRDVGAYFGLTPRRYQSGEVDRSGRISKVGDGAVRAALYEAATVLLRRMRCERPTPSS